MHLSVKGPVNKCYFYKSTDPPTEAEDWHVLVITLSESTGKENVSHTED